MFEICNSRGLNGEHGGLTPAANVEHPMLRDAADDQGNDPSESPSRRVQARLEALSRQRRELSAEAKSACRK